MGCGTLLVEAKKACREKVVFGLPSKCQEAAIGLRMYTDLLRGEDPHNLVQGGDKEVVANRSCGVVVKRVRRRRARNTKKKLVPQKVFASCEKLATWVSDVCLQGLTKGNGRGCEMRLPYAELKYAKNEEERAELCAQALKESKKAK